MWRLKLCPGRPSALSRVAERLRSSDQPQPFCNRPRRRLFTPDHLLDAACSDPVPRLRAPCADWLMDIGHAGHAGHGSLLLESNSVEPRLVAVTRMPDDDLSDDRLQALVLDRASRVRERARWRAHRRGLDVVGCYRSQLGMSSRPPRLIAACLDGIAILGDESDLPACIGHLGHSNARVRAAAVGAILTRAANDDAVRLLAPVLLDASPRVSAHAARSLARLDAPPSVADEAWASERQGVRRAAWRVTRASGGWDRVQADLRLAGDPDPRLSSLGRAAISGWLNDGAATVWAPPREAQRTRIRDLLDAAGLSAEQSQLVAFHAAIERRARVPDPSSHLRSIDTTARVLADADVLI